jgi:hypothetical protein
MWGALSDERTGLSFTIASGPRQRSHFRVRVQWDSWPYFTVSDSRLPFSSLPATRMVTVEVFFFSIPGKGQEIFLYSTASWLTLGPTQPPIQRLPASLSPGIKRRPRREADYSPRSSVPYVFKEWCLINKTEGQLYLLPAMSMPIWLFQAPVN